MGGLRKYMPITFWTSLLGSLALIGFPGFSGFFSKDTIIEAVHLSQLPGSGFAYWMVLLGVFVTALYSFRMLFMVFHGNERMEEHTREHLHESPAVVTLPLVMLAVPSVVIGYLTVGPVAFGDYFGDAIRVLPEHDVHGALAEHYAGPVAFIVHGLLAPAVWLAAAGFLVAWYVYLHRPDLAETAKSKHALLYDLLQRKYGFDEFNEYFFAGGARGLGAVLWRVGDVRSIDGVMVNGTARLVGWFSVVLRQIQSGYLFHYAFAMIIGLLALLSLFVFR